MFRIHNINTFGGLESDIVSPPAFGYNSPFGSQDSSLDHAIRTWELSFNLVSIYCYPAIKPA